MPGTGTDAGETIGTSTSQQVHENCLGPIIGSVSQCGIGAKNSMASGASPCLEVRSEFKHHPLGAKSSPELLGNTGDQFCLGLRTLPQTMFHMHSGHPATGSDREDQQREGISTPRDSTEQLRARGRKMTASQQFPMAVAQLPNSNGHCRVRDRAMGGQTAPSGTRMRSIQR